MGIEEFINQYGQQEAEKTAHLSEVTQEAMDKIKTGKQTDSKTTPQFRTGLKQFRKEDKSPTNESESSLDQSFLKKAKQATEEQKKTDRSSKQATSTTTNKKQLLSKGSGVIGKSTISKK